MKLNAASTSPASIPFSTPHAWIAAKVARHTMYSAFIILPRAEEARQRSEAGHQTVAGRDEGFGTRCEQQAANSPVPRLPPLTKLGNQLTKKNCRKLYDTSKHQPVMRCSELKQLLRRLLCYAGVVWYIVCGCVTLRRLLYGLLTRPRFVRMGQTSGRCPDLTHLLR